MISFPGFLYVQKAVKNTSQRFFQLFSFLETQSKKRDHRNYRGANERPLDRTLKTEYKIQTMRCAEEQ